MRYFNSCWNDLIDTLWKEYYEDKYVYDIEWPEYHFMTPIINSLREKLNEGEL